MSFSFYKPRVFFSKEEVESHYEQELKNLTNQFNKSFKEKHLNADGVTWAGVATPVSKEDMISLTGEVKGLIFHCAEFPSKEELTSEKFMQGKYTHRSVVVNEHNQAFDAITKHPRERGDGQIPDLGVRAIDYNDLEGTRYHDLAEIYK